MIFNTIFIVKLLFLTVNPLTHPPKHKLYWITPILTDRQPGDFQDSCQRVEAYLPSKMRCSAIIFNRQLLQTQEIST